MQHPMPKAKIGRKPRSEKNGDGDPTRPRHARTPLQTAEAEALRSGLLFHNQKNVFTREKLVFLWYHEG